MATTAPMRCVMPITLRELIYAFEHDEQRWAKNMHTLLLELNDAVTEAGGALSPEEAKA